MSTASADWRTRCTGSLVYLRRLDEKFDRSHGEVGELRTGVRELRIEVGGLRSEIAERLGRIEDELLVLNGIVIVVGIVRLSLGGGIV